MSLVASLTVPDAYAKHGAVVFQVIRNSKNAEGRKFQVLRLEGSITAILGSYPTSANALTIAYSHLCQEIYDAENDSKGSGSQGATDSRVQVSG